MEDDLDRLLTRVAAVPTPPGLTTLSDVVLTRVHADAAAARGGTMIGLAATLGALILGASATLVAPAATPAAALDPFGSSDALAPSTLLVGDR